NAASAQVAARGRSPPSISRAGSSGGKSCLGSVTRTQIRCAAAPFGHHAMLREGPDAQGTFSERKEHTKNVVVPLDITGERGRAIPKVSERRPSTETRSHVAALFAGPHDELHN